MMRVGTMGLGYVGLPLTAAVSIFGRSKPLSVKVFPPQPSTSKPPTKQLIGHLPSDNTMPLSTVNQATQFTPFFAPNLGTRPAKRERSATGGPRSSGALRVVERLLHGSQHVRCRKRLFQEDRRRQPLFALRNTGA